MSKSSPNMNVSHTPIPDLKEQGRKSTLVLKNTTPEYVGHTVNNGVGKLRVLKNSGNTLKFIQMYGERNSGTSFLSKILRENMKLPQNFLGVKATESTPLGTKIFGYKHWYTKPSMFEDYRQEETLFIIIYRNPYTWLRAMLDRPYALSKSIMDKRVDELPGLELVGHINGKDTLNEFHPESGDKVDIFGLRRLKIENFESVERYVKNIVYLNFESLLKNPEQNLYALSKEFGSLFQKELTFETVPPRALVREIKKPRKFSSEETYVINSHVDWSMEKLVGYERNNYLQTSSEKTKFIILHGSSSVGKSHTLARLLKEREGLHGIEMDDCRYWDEYEPNFEEKKIKMMFPDLTADTFHELIDIVSNSGIKCQRNTEFLLSQLHELFTGSSPTKGTFKLIVATCGALAFPSPEHEKSIYRWLEQQLPVNFYHILIEVPEELHLARMEKRGRSHLKGEILKNYNRRELARESHDAVVSDYEQVLVIVDAMSD